MNSAAIMSAAIAGLACGFILPYASKRVIAAKYRQETYGQANKILSSKPIRALIMLINAAGFVWIFQYAKNLISAAVLILVWVLGIVISEVDYEIHKIPNETVLILAILGLLFQYFYFGGAGVIQAVFTMIIVAAVFVAIAGFIGFHTVGAGDVKLAGAMGAVLGYPYILTGLIAMSIVMAIYSGIGIAMKRMTLKSMVSFAPFMMAGLGAAIAVLIKSA